MSYQLPTLPSPSNVDIMEKSSETMNWLRRKIRVGFTSERGPAWWANGAVTKAGVWEGIPDGSHFDGPVPMEEVTKLLDIKLVKGTVFIQYEDAYGNRQVVADPKTMPIMNQDTGQVFSYPKEGYKIHPYLETLAGFIAKITDDSQAVVGSCGLLKNDGVAFLQAVLPERFEVAGYGYQPYITAVTSADMSRSTFYGTGMLGAVCDNTVDSAVAGALTKLRIRHTRNSGVSVTDARDRLGIQLVQVGAAMGEAIKELLNVPVSRKEFGQWLDLAVPLVDETGQPKVKQGLTIAENKRTELTRLYTIDDKAAPWNGTAFGVLQTANTWQTWEGRVKGADGGMMERNYTRNAMGVTGKNDLAALEMLGKVLGRELVAA